MPNRSNKLRLDLIETGGIALFASLCSLCAGLYAWSAAVSAVRAPSESAWLEKAYGPSHYSRDVEEWVIRDFFKDQRDGLFVDVGAGDYRLDSNTFYLEERLGWHGIAVDPLRELEADYRKYRPHTRFFALFVSDVSGSQAEVFVSDRFSQRSSANRESAGLQGGKIAEISVPTVTLTDLLNLHGISHIDLLSIDIELSEPKALKGLDIDRFRPRLVCIEAHQQVRQQILDYFAKHGYVLIGKYLRADALNLYFTPLS